MLILLVEYELGILVDQLLDRIFHEFVERRQLLPDEALGIEELVNDQPAIFLCNLIVVIIFFYVRALVDIVVVRVLRCEGALGKQGHCEAKRSL